MCLTHGEVKWLAINLRLVGLLWEPHWPSSLCHRVQGIVHLLPLAEGSGWFYPGAKTSSSARQFALQAI